MSIQTGRQSWWGGHSFEGWRCLSVGCMLTWYCTTKKFISLSLCWQKPPKGITPVLSVVESEMCSGLCCGNPPGADFPRHVSPLGWGQGWGLLKGILGRGERRWAWELRVRPQGLCLGSLPLSCPHWRLVLVLWPTRPPRATPHRRLMLLAVYVYRCPCPWTLYPQTRSSDASLDARRGSPFRM